MHGRVEGEERKRLRHMWPAPAPATAAAAAAPAATIPPPPGPIINPSPSNSHPSAPDSFLKDGREIRVGESALFQAGNAPPFIGIIRWIRSSEEDYLKLCVNWLYRPADIKLAKGTTLDAAPNEVFYSFHKDVVSAASLLHPCKVAFLRKGVELPRGISSFVCRRVYDIENKRLWWLTDKNYINERQEEVDRLLNRTGLEMHAAVQSGGRSPKRSSNSPSSTQQVKSGSDTVQNSSSSFHSQVKGKKRDRAESGPEPVKRDHSTKPEDVDPSNIKLDNMKAEIGKITEKGGLSNVEAVEKLVNLMLLDRTEKKIDLAGKVMLANVIAATERYDCLGKFVQLMALPVLDDWLQEAHKGKTGDNTSPKEGDKGVEELLLALLRALDKLPVNLNALQTSSVGKSVNNLRSHKNLEIQKKARSLVDTWKKRVDAEMKINDAKSLIAGQAVAWPGKPGFSDVSNSGNRRMGSTDLTTKSSSTQPPPSKALTSKPGHSDSITKSNLLASSSSKLHSSSTIPAAISSTQTTIKEEKSNSSSHSQNNSQSSWKDDARSSTAGSTNGSKASGGSSRHRRSNNGLIGAAVSGAQKESSLGKSASPNRTASLDKALQGGLACEKPLDTPVGDLGNSHRLIVRLPNPGRSPVRSATGSAFEDLSITGSRMASPGNEHSDQKMKQRGDSSRSQGHTEVNTESPLSRDAKEGPAGSEEAEETGRASDIAKTPLVESGARNSFSSINALIESCAQYAESSSALIPVGDDGGMNLLASVAAGEISQSSLNTPSGSPGVSPVVEEPCVGDYEVRGILKSEEAAESESGKNEKNGGIMGTDPQQTNLPSQENKTAGPNGQLIVSDSNHDRNTNSFVKTSGKGEEENVTRPGLVNKKCESDGAHNQADKPVVTKHATADPIDRGPSLKIPSTNEESEPCGKPHSAKVSGKNEDGREEAAGPLADASSLGTKPEPDVAAKLDFDLNEGIGGDDTSQLAAPAKGPFVPPENLLKSKGEPGWKGSAATSAFRPAEPRKVLDMPLGTSETVGSDASGKHGRLLLDFDLNVPDEGLLEDMGSQGSAQTTGSASGSVTNLDARTKATGGGLDLDLNRVDEVPDNLQSLAKSNRRLSTAEINGLRDFDLNNGPELNEASAVATPRSQVSKSTTNMSFLSPASAFRMNNDELRNMSSWFPTGNSLPAVAIPSFLPERGEQPYPVVAAPGPQQRILGPVASGGHLEVISIGVQYSPHLLRWLFLQLQLFHMQASISAPASLSSQHLSQPDRPMRTRCP
uniref:BAH domain-containing protein n=1 Tax=Ananas comosus var. bracteatus TaxID=296719 RepID=A0A6V7P397_ANACO|nr:unnamed protein product [Ananas comosus var. bracteatus]